MTKIRLLILLLLASESLQAYRAGPEIPQTIMEPKLQVRESDPIFDLLDQNGDSISNSLLPGLLIYGHGTVCDDNFSDEAADLICQVLGFRSAHRWTSGLLGYETLQNELPTSLDDIDCRSNHRSFWDCNFNTYDEDCSHTEDIVMSCRDGADMVLQESDFYMVDEMGSPFNVSGKEGMLMFRDGTVCDDAFNDKAADLICQAMGFKVARSWRSGFYRSVIDQHGILLDDLSCYEDDEITSVEHCSYTIGDHNCDYRENVILTCSDTPRGFYQLVPDSGRAWAVGMAIMGENDHPQLTGWLCDDGFNDIAAAQLCHQIMRTRYGKRAPSGPVTEGLPFVATNYTCNYEGRCQEDVYKDSHLTCNNRTERAAVYCYNSNREYDLSVQSVAVTPAGKIFIKMRIMYLKEGEVHSLHGDSAKEKISVGYCGQSVKLKGVFGRDGRYKVTGKTRGRPCSQNCLRIYIGGIVYHEEGPGCALHPMWAGSYPCYPGCQ